MRQGFYHPDDQAMIEAHHEALRHAQDGEVRRLEYRARHADGHWVWLSGRETPFERGPDGLVKQIVGISQDITARKAAQDKLAYQANFDALTGLSNRHHFWTRLQSVAAAGEHRAFRNLALPVRCRSFQGHQRPLRPRGGRRSAGGHRQHRARPSCGRRDIAGRLGGDEFCFALPRTDEQRSARVAERIRERL